MTVIRTLLVLIFLSVYSCSAAPGEIPEPLPDIFDPFSWEMNLKELDKFFPKSRIKESEYTAFERGEYKKTKAITISALTWKHFGPAYVRIHHKNYKTVNMIRLETEESRTECQILSEKPMPEWCRHKYNKELLQVLEGVKNEVSKVYGSPVEYNASTAYVPDLREKGCMWKRSGFDLFLAISRDEQGFWSVDLTASRH